MNTITKSRQRTPGSKFSSPLDRFFRNDLLDFWNADDSPVETIPSINITESQNNYEIEMAAPGMKKDDFSVDVDDNVITISSEKESENKSDREGKNYMFREYNYSRFSRSFTIPDNAETSKISAKYADGILCLTIPKKTEQLKNKTQKIKID